MGEALDDVDVLIDFAGNTPEPYVAGTLIAARRAPAHTGLTRGLDTLLLRSG